MKKLLFAFFVFLILFPLVIISTIFASSDKDKKLVVLSKDTVVDEDYFAFGEKVNISGVVNGDVYTGAASVLIDGTVNGDLIAGGGSVMISGDVTQDIRVAGGNILISGNVGGNVTSAGGTITFSEDSEIEGSVLIGGGSVNLLGPIGKGGLIGVGDLTINNTFGGNVKVYAESITLGSSSNVEGNFDYWSENEANVLDGSITAGQLTKHEPEIGVDVEQNKQGFNFNLGFKIFSIISTFILGLLILRLIPKFTNDIADSSLNNKLKSVLIGLVTIILFPFVFVLLLITVVGIPIAIILLFSLITTLILVKTFVSFALGKYIGKVANLKVDNWVLLLIGIVVYTIISSFPIVGVLFSIAAYLIGIGAVLLSKKALYKAARDKKLL